MSTPEYRDRPIDFLGPRHYIPLNIYLIVIIRQVAILCKEAMVMCMLPLLAISLQMKPLWPTLLSSLTVESWSASRGSPPFGKAHLVLLVALPAPQLDSHIF